jgi:hypothetical protein
MDAGSSVVVNAIQRSVNMLSLCANDLEIRSFTTIYVDQGAATSRAAIVPASDARDLLASASGRLGSRFHESRALSRGRRQGGPRVASPGRPEAGRLDVRGGGSAVAGVQSTKMGDGLVRKADSCLRRREVIGIWNRGAFPEPVEEQPTEEPAVAAGQPWTSLGCGSMSGCSEARRGAC